MKKNVCLLVLISIAIALFSGCSKNNSTIEESNINTTNTHVETTTENADPVIITETQIATIDIEPDISQIRNICQLATLRCYYHNTAREKKPAGRGFTHIGESDTPYWFEYDAQATLGIDFSKVQMSIDGNNITILIPHAEILGDIIVDPNSTSEPIYPPNAWNRNDVEITAADVTESMRNANENVREQILSDTATLFTAEERSRDLIENYIEQIMALSGVDYSITWEYVDE